ncbi:hypothetical protein FHS18_006826 [Paenibacillus phyllosphaerae]|uniref:Uncharacterized protein n=1 Tax=Paenibacillus phyllosphaerae TaxID=274593 RepID=A0A7W5B5R7_9BACL|nr:hypothetical protein [Paenibacillus phyllosphaerae]
MGGTLGINIIIGDMFRGHLRGEVLIIKYYGHKFHLLYISPLALSSFFTLYTRNNTDKSHLLTDNALCFSNALPPPRSVLETFTP